MRRVNEDSLQAMEAMYFAIDEINSDPNILPNVRVGAVMFDSCRNSTRILRQLSKYFKDDTLPLAVVGASDSRVTTTIAEVMKRHKLPVISYASTDPVLSDTTLFPYLLRAVPSDVWQASVIVSLLKKFQWDYITAFYSDSAYGRSSFSEFLRLTEAERICLGSQVMLADYLVNDAKTMEDLVRFYISRRFARCHVVVLFTSDWHTRSLLSAYKSWMRNSGNLNRVIWIGTNGWGSRLDVVSGLETIVDGAFTIGFYSEDIPRFKQHLMTRTLENDGQNPWFKEYWQQQLGCYIHQNDKNIYAPVECKSNQTLADLRFRMADRVPYVIDSVYTIALALDELIKRCREPSEVYCISKYRNSDTLFRTMRNLDFFSEITKLQVSYDILGNGIPRYNIFNLRYDEKRSVYDYYTVGNWTDTKFEIDSSGLIVYLASLPNLNITSTCQTCACSDGRVADLKYQMNYGGLTLIGFFPIHGSSQDQALCSKMDNIDGFLQFMAFKYAIEQMNKDATVLRNITLGFLAFDTCSDPDQASLAYRSWSSGLQLFTQKPQAPIVTYTNGFVAQYDHDVTMMLNKVNSIGKPLVQVRIT